MKLFDFLRESSLENIDFENENRLLAHAEILARKKILQEVFIEFHHIFRRLDEKFFSAPGLKIELGAGISPIRTSYPDVLAADIVYAHHLDRIIDAEKMDLADHSVRVVYGQNCFHHFAHPNRFFSELNRVLAVDGGVILLEPYYGPFASFLFKRLFRQEYFDKNSPSWETPTAGFMNNANQALSYIIFIRDRTDFEQKYPMLQIVYQELCNNYLKYLLSGGLNFKQLFPNWGTRLLDFFQLVLSPLNRLLSLHHIIVIKKIAKRSLIGENSV